MDELELDDFRHGGVNITGFSLLDTSSPRLQAFRREWSHLDPKYWHGAGRGRKITVSHYATTWILTNAGARRLRSADTAKCCPSNLQLEDWHSIECKLTPVARSPSMCFCTLRLCDSWWNIPVASLVIVVSAVLVLSCGQTYTQTLSSAWA